MQVIFIHHSCFLVEVDDLVLIFDYFGGDRVNGFHFTGKIPDYARNTKIYMVCQPANIRSCGFCTWIFCAGVKNIPMYIIFYPRRISAVSVPHFLQKHGIDPGGLRKLTFVSANNHYEVDDLKIQLSPKMNRYAIPSPQ